MSKGPPDPFLTIKQSKQSKVIKKRVKAEASIPTDASRSKPIQMSNLAYVSKSSSCLIVLKIATSEIKCSATFYVSGGFRVQLCAASADILLTPPPPIITDGSAAADRMSASRERRYCDVFTPCRTPAYMLLDFCFATNAVYNEAVTLTKKTVKTMQRCFAMALDTQINTATSKQKRFRGQCCENES